MWYLVTAVVGIACFVVGFNVGQKSRNAEVWKLHRESVIDRSAFLNTLRRELANIMMWREPDAYVELWLSLSEEIEQLSEKPRSELVADLSVITALYPTYLDFDVIGVKEYVLYDDGVDALDATDISARYRDVVMFQALMHKLDPSWKEVLPLHSKDAGHLQSYAQRVKDSKSAVLVASALERGLLLKSAEDKDRYQDRIGTMQRLWDPVERKYGVHLRESDEYFTHSTYYFDDGRVHESIYRSDPEFATSTPLRTIPAVLNSLEEQLGLISKIHWWNSKSNSALDLGGARNH